MEQTAPELATTPLPTSAGPRERGCSEKPCYHTASDAASRFPNVQFLRESAVINSRCVVVVRPAYNAEKTLENTVRELPDFVDPIILVDEGLVGSGDNGSGRYFSPALRNSNAS